MDEILRGIDKYTNAIQWAKHTRDYEASMRYARALDDLYAKLGQLSPNYAHIA